MQSVQGGLFPYTLSHSLSYGFPRFTVYGFPRFTVFIGTKAPIAENRQLALVAGIMANGPPEPPRAEHWPADTAKQAAEHRRATSPKHNAHHWPLD